MIEWLWQGLHTSIRANDSEITIADNGNSGDDGESSETECPGEVVTGKNLYDTWSEYWNYVDYDSDITTFEDCIKEGMWVIQRLKPKGSSIIVNIFLYANSIQGQRRIHPPSCLLMNNDWSLPFGPLDYFDWWFWLIICLQKTIWYRKRTWLYK